MEHASTTSAAVPTVADAPALNPILVSTATVRRLIDVKRTRFWELVKLGRLDMVDIGTGRRMVTFASLQGLIAR